MSSYQKSVEKRRNGVDPDSSIEFSSVEQRSCESRMCPRNEDPWRKRIDSDSSIEFSVVEQRSCVFIVKIHGEKDLTPIT